MGADTYGGEDVAAPGGGGGSGRAYIIGRVSRVGAVRPASCCVILLLLLLLLNALPAHGGWVGEQIA